MTDISNAHEVAEEHSKPGKFNFIERVESRNYPTLDVEIYLDEKAGHRIQQLLQEREYLRPDDTEALEANDSDLALWRKKAAESRYIVHMEGISTEKYDEIVELAQEQYPLEYRERQNPLTFKIEREVIESDERETLFRTHLWSAFIRSIEDTSGNVDDNITPEFVAMMNKGLPLVAQARIADGVDELRMITAWMDNIQDADFLAKS